MKRLRNDDDYDYRYRKGEAVEVFFRWSSDTSFPCSLDVVGCQPRVAMTDGWMCGHVVEYWPPADGMPSRVKVTVAAPCWMDRHGDLTAEPHAGTFDACDVRPVGDDAGASPPVLSLLLVRWGGPDGAPNEEDHCGATTSSVTNGYIAGFLSMLYSCLGPQYEAVSVFVQNSADLNGMRDGELARMLHGTQCGALYFLWPSRFRDGVATRFMHGVPLRVGMVNAGATFDAIHRMEARGVPTRFPHASQL